MQTELDTTKALVWPELLSCTLPVPPLGSKSVGSPFLPELLSVRQVEEFLEIKFQPISQSTLDRCGHKVNIG